MAEGKRFTDAELHQFYQDFLSHVKEEEEQKKQQSEIYAALFQQEDPNKNIPAGVVQLMGRISKDVSDMKIKDDRQKRFIGGVVFAFSCVGFLFTDMTSRIAHFLRSL